MEEKKKIELYEGMILRCKKELFIYMATKRNENPEEKIIGILGERALTEGEEYLLRWSESRQEWYIFDDRDAPDNDHVFGERFIRYYFDIVK